MESIVILGIIFLITSLFLRIVAIADEIHTNKIVIFKNLIQLHQIDFNENPELKEKVEYLYKLNQQISKELNIKPPPIFIQDTETDNAIAINTGIFQAVIFESRTLNGLDSQGLGAVLAHELFHIQQKHYLKSIALHLFLTTIWILINVLGLFVLVDSLQMTEPTTRGEAYFWIISLIFFYTSSIFMGDRLILVVERFISRLQEIQCDKYAAQATSFGDYLIEALYFKQKEDSYYLNQKISHFNALKATVYNTHPNWPTRIVAVANDNYIIRK